MVGMAQSAHAFSFNIGPKGRSVIPASVRREAGFAEGDEVVAIALGHGRVLLETAAAVRQRVWDAAPQGAAGNVSEDVRRMRLDDVAVSDAAAARRTGDEVGDEQSAARGAALLAKLGL